MMIPTFMLAACLGCDIPVESPHDRNPVFANVLNQGLAVEEARVTLPPPLLADGQDANAQRVALRQVAGSERALDDLLRDSVTAPFIIKVHDTKTAHATVRQVHAWFVVRGDLKKIDPAGVAGRTEQKEVEVANMLFQTRFLKADEVRTAGVVQKDLPSNLNEWYAHIHSTLLDRIDFEITNHIVASQSPESIVIASTTDDAFSKKGRPSNVWKSLTNAGGSQEKMPAEHPYSGGVSYAKISRLAFQPTALVIELRAAFVEPDEWFQGAPILRSKFSIVAQDQIRALRRELAKSRAN